MRKLYIIIFFTLILSCKKEIFPNKDLLIGTWTEENGNNSKLIFDNNTMILLTDYSSDTSNYKLDTEANKIIMFSTKYANTSSEHKIVFDKNEGKLKIWDLFGGIPENENVNIFIKE